MTTPPESIEPNEKSTVAPPRRQGIGFWIFLSFLTLVLAGLIVFFALNHRAGQVVEAGMETVVEIAEIFRPEVVVKTFNEWRELKIKATDGNILEIATAESSEHFTRETARAISEKVIPGTTTISEITVPATYRFHIDLNAEWNIISDGTRLLVEAPPVEPSLPVAFDTARVEKRTHTGWIPWDRTGNMEALEKEITGKLAERARQPETLGKVREQARIAVAKFVQNWLIDEGAWAEGKFEEIVVGFKGESDSPLSARPASIRLGNEKLVLP